MALRNAILAAAVLACVNSDGAAIRVTIDDGELEGQWIESAIGDGSKFAAFRSIPFAQPPIGSLRFKAPRPPVKWEGVLNASVESAVCVQLGNGDGVIGSEDCLYLNVYTPQLPASVSNLLALPRQPSTPTNCFKSFKTVTTRSKTSTSDSSNCQNMAQDKNLLPVLIYIYGGAFVSGSNSIDRFGPDFLVNQGIVVVLPKYRVNAFGFLSLDSEEIPGNAGLKDQVAAVNWVYKNIQKFGGDPNSLVISGQSAGAGSAHWLAQLPDLKGKFKRAIIMSGSAYHSWAYTEHFLEVANVLGQQLTNSTTALEKKQLTKLFMEASTEDLGRVAGIYGNAWQGPNGDGPDLGFAPTPERRPLVDNGEPRVITRDSESYFLNREVPPIPTIVGITNREWTRFALDRFGFDNVSTVNSRLGNMMSLIPKNIVPYEDTKKLFQIPADDNSSALYSDIIKKVYSEYFETNNATCDIKCKAVLYCDNIYIQTDTNRWAQYRARVYPDVPVYLYRFSLTGEYNPSFLGPNTKHTAVHADDLRYVFYSAQSKQDYNGSGIASQTLRRMTKMFTNFVKQGVPVPETDDLLSVAWEPNTSSEPRVTLLDIDEEVTLRYEQLAGEHVDFWDGLYERYRQRASYAACEGLVFKSLEARLFVFFNVLVLQITRKVLFS